MMKQFKITLIIILFTFSSMAQNNDEALNMLNDVEKKGMSYKSIKSDIEYLLENKQDDKNEKVKGTILIKGKKFQLDIDETLTFCDGKNKWVYLTESNEVNLTEVVASEDLEPEEKFMNEPLSIYSLYKNDFKYNITGTAEFEGKKYTVIDLTPKSLDKPYFKIRYWISESKDIYALKYFQKDGMRITLTFIEFKTNEKIKDSEFVFKESNYPDVEVIDLR